jgi:hypothetical protein
MRIALSRQSWSQLIILLNGEKELRREVVGKYRHDRGPISLGGGYKSRVKIYAAVLQAASQFPDCSARLVLKAAGRAPWEGGDVSEKASKGWRGEWHDHSSFGGWDVYIKQLMISSMLGWNQTRRWPFIGIATKPHVRRLSRLLIDWP